MGSAQTDAASCGPQCQSTGGCTHFSWTPPNNCWLKNGAVSLGNAFPSATSGIVCGLNTGSSAVSDEDSFLGDVFDQAVDASFDEAVDATFDQAVDASFEEPIDTTFDQAVDASFDQAVDVSFDQSVDASFDQSVDDIENSFEQAVDASFDPLEAEFNAAIGSEGNFDASIEGGLYDAAVAESVSQSTQSQTSSSVSLQGWEIGLLVLFSVVIALLIVVIIQVALYLRS